MAGSPRLPDRLRQQPVQAEQYECLERLAAEHHEIDREAYTDAKAAREFDVTVPTAQKAIESLVTQGILTEVTGRKRNRVYLSPRIMDAVYGLPDDATSDVEG